VEVSELEKDQRPQSPDPPFWAVWTGKEKRPIDWQKISLPWGGPPVTIEDSNENGETSFGGPQNPSPNQDDDIPF
jgi:hypothetical protein